MNFLIGIAAIAGILWSPAGMNIRTRWADEVSPENARTEYPRPQMVRGNWVCLNGLWDYAITTLDAPAFPGKCKSGAAASGEKPCCHAPKGEKPCCHAPSGEKPCCHGAAPVATGEILVPFCIESSLSGVCARVNPDQALWYRRTIEAPASWQGKRIILHFDAVDWQAEVFVAGKRIGEHKGGYSAFSFDVTEHLAAGPAELEVRVWDSTDAPGYRIPRGKQNLNPKGIWYTPVTGIWQSVWMEAVEPVHVVDYNVVPSIDGTLAISVDLEGTPDDVKVEVLRPRKGYNPEKPGWSLFRKAVAHGTDVSVKIRRPKLWTPDEPWLYGLRIKVYKDGKLVDRVEGYTAVRTVTAREDEAGVRRLALNDRILFQIGPLDQGWWPDGLYTAPTAEAMAWDIEKTKDLGFNMIRKHVKVEPSRWYYDCDRLGMMVWQDMPCTYYYENRSDWAQGEDRYGAGRDQDMTPEQKENFLSEWSEVLSQFRKFPSIVVWVPFNEAWGQFDTQAVCDFTRAADPTRLINAASGGNWIKGAGEILDSHKYPNPVMRILDPEMVNVLGEYGGIGRPIDGHTWDIGRKWGYVQYDSEEKVTDTYCLYAGDLIDLKQRDMCAAAVYTQTTDVEGEVNGLVTYDREIVKVNEQKVREANQAVIAAPNTASVPIVAPHAFHYKDPSAGVRDHLNLFTLRGGDLTMQVTEFGARVISLFTPDRNGEVDDIVVGYGDAPRFVHNPGERFLGATVGRVANRIAGGSFTLDGKEYRLPQNNNGQTLHGGLKGVDMVVWKVLERTPSSVKFGCTLPDGQDGFPGKLKIEMTYTLTGDNCFDIVYSATTDKPTPVNLSNHAFFNLRGSSGGSILDHSLTIDADAITPVDKYLIPTGELLPVEGTPFDFREPHRIGERVSDSHVQLELGGGYDHNFVLNAPADGSLHLVCTVTEETTGRVMEILTDQPGLQFYCGNFFDGSTCGKVPGQSIGYREAFALECQKWPDGVHHPQFPDTILRPGEVYTQHTVYRFSAK